MAQEMPLGLYIYIYIHVMIATVFDGASESSFGMATFLIKGSGLTTAGTAVERLSSGRIRSLRTLVISVTIFGRAKASLLSKDPFLREE